MKNFTTDSHTEPQDGAPMFRTALNREHHDDQPTTEAPTKPAPCSVQAENIPDPLKKMPWVGWRWELNKNRDKWTKPPRNARTGKLASSTEPQTWSSFDEAFAAYEAGKFDGIGCVFSSADPYAGVDLDNCLSRDGSGNLIAARWAAEIVSACDSYTEISPSGNGLKIWIAGKLPPTAGNTKGGLGDDRRGKVEIFDGGRYFTATGHKWNGAPKAIHERQAQLDALHAKLFPAPQISAAPSPVAPSTLDDAELLRKAMSAANGAKFSALWRGDTSDQGGDASRADAALCSMLAFWTGRDVARMDRLFRSSGLMRPKWDERHRADGATYGAITLEKAGALGGETYDPSGGAEPFAPFAPLFGATGEENNFVEAPAPLTSALRPVPAFTPEMLPVPLRAWVSDAAERISCPPDFVAVPVVIALASLIGRKVVIRPKRFDDWEVVSNLWGATIGRPGQKKTPAANEATRFLEWLQAKALEDHAVAEKEAELDKRLNEVQSNALKDRLKKAAAKGASRDELREIELKNCSPAEGGATLKRYLVNEATVEALGVILSENPRGVLVNRDELTGWLHSLDKQGREMDKAFYLEAFNGTKQNFTYDRIMRGRLTIPHVCVSLFGTIQPGPLGQLVRAASGERQQRDGFISRFQMLVYPDVAPYARVDRWPDKEAKRRAFEVFTAMDNLTAETTGAQIDGDELPYLRFDQEAQEFFNEWYDALQIKLSNGKETTLLEEHLTKYASLMPSLALVFHLSNVVDGEAEAGPVSHRAALQAAAWCEYLEAHARRIYGQAFDGDTEVIERLGERLGELPTPFTVRDILKKKWGGLTEREEVESLLMRLQEKHWVEGRRADATGGRPTIKFWINPALLKNDGDSEGRAEK
jgi:putative DNA primase/helicase